MDDDRSMTEISDWSAARATADMPEIVPQAIEPIARTLGAFPSHGPRRTAQLGRSVITAIYRQP